MCTYVLGRNVLRIAMCVRLEAERFKNMTPLATEWSEVQDHVFVSSRPRVRKISNRTQREGKVTLPPGSLKVPLVMITTTKTLIYVCL